MDNLIDTLEGRLQLVLGQKEFEIQVLKHSLSESYKEVEDLKARLKESEV